MDLKHVSTKQLDQMEQLAKELLDTLREVSQDEGMIHVRLEVFIHDVATELQHRRTDTAHQANNVLKQLPNWDNEGESSDGDLKT